MEIRAVDLLSDDPEQQRLAEGFVRVQDENQRALWGERHTGWSADELRGHRRRTSHRYVDLVALDGEAVVGMVAVAMPLHDNTGQALVMLRTAPGHERRGIGSALLVAAEQAAREAGRTTVECETESRADAPDHAEQFARGRGYASAQVMIRSEMAFPVDRERIATIARGDRVRDARRFDVQVRVDDVPDAWLPGLAELEQRMSTDAPQGDREVEEEVWTPARVREDLDWAAGAGRHVVLAIAFDDDRAVGFSMVQIPRAAPASAYQWDTLVLREARGHRLGARLKAAVALEIDARFPQVEVVLTWNADDNTHMLATNRELGYRRTGTQTVWTKRLS